MPKNGGTEIILITNLMTVEIVQILYLNVYMQVSIQK